MSNLKKSNKKLNLLIVKKFLSKKNYLIFKINNNNKFIHNFVYKKLNNNFISAFYNKNKDTVYLNVLINLNNYILVKKKMKNLLILESFSYSLVGVKFEKNLLTLDFFEKNFLEKTNKILVVNDLFMYIYIKFLTWNVLLKKKLFIFIYLFFINLNILKYNAYNTSSSK